MGSSKQRTKRKRRQARASLRNKAAKPRHALRSGRTGKAKQSARKSAHGGSKWSNPAILARATREGRG